MNQIDWSIRQYLYDRLINDERFVNVQLGVNWRDTTYHDYSEAIGFLLTKNDFPRVVVLIKESSVKCLLIPHIMVVKSIFSIDIDPYLPNFPQLNNFEDIIAAKIKGKLLEGCHQTE